MNNYTVRIMVECKNLNQIVWMAEHIELYSSSTKYGKDILLQIKEYGANIHTYPYEAKKAFETFCKHFYNNPYKYMGSNCIVDNQTMIFSSSLNGYLICMEKNLWVPIGFARQVNCNFYTETEAIIAKFLKKCLEDYNQQDYQPYKHKVDYANKAGTDAFLRFEADKRVKNGTISLSILMEIILSVLFIWCFIKYVGFGHIFSFVYLIIGILIILFYGNRTRQAIKSVGRIKDTSKALSALHAYDWKFTQIYKEKLTIKALLEADVTNGIQPYWKEEEFNRIIDMERFVNSKRLKSLPVKANFQMLLLCGGLLILSGVRSIDWDGLMNKRPDQMEALQSADTFSSMATSQSSEEGRTAVFDEKGFLFGDGDSRYLTSTEIYELQNIEGYDFKTLLGFARNEFYARKGFAFKEDGQYYPFYMQYSWYSEISHGDVTDSMFNSYERANLDLIISIEKQEGYR